jgi:hypothetical protein
MPPAGWVLSACCWCRTGACGGARPGRQACRQHARLSVLSVEVPALWHPPLLSLAIACLPVLQVWPGQRAQRLCQPQARRRVPASSICRWAAGPGLAGPGPGVAPPTSSFATLHLAPCRQCTSQLCASGNQCAPTVPRPPPILPVTTCVACRAAANVTRSAAWSAGVAPPVITYLMAMNHEPVVNSGEVSRQGRQCGVAAEGLAGRRGQLAGWLAAVKGRLLLQLP